MAVSHQCMKPPNTVVRNGVVRTTSVVRNECANLFVTCSGRCQLTESKCRLQESDQPVGISDMLRPLSTHRVRRSTSRVRPANYTMSIGSTSRVRPLAIGSSLLSPSTSLRSSTQVLLVRQFNELHVLSRAQVRLGTQACMPHVCCFTSPGCRDRMCGTNLRVSGHLSSPSGTRYLS
jgi:hypothetical protein